MKKANKIDLGLPLDKFSEKFWEDNRGMCHQFSNEWRKGGDIFKAIKCLPYKKNFQDNNFSLIPIEWKTRY